jgi:uncharacterized repeat protein (TIGR01451 family)
LPAGSNTTVETKLTAEMGTNTGSLITTTTNATVEVVVTGTVGGQIQQSSSTEVVYVNPNNTSQLLFSRYNDNLITKDSTDSWTASWADLNNDGFDDLFVTDRRISRPNLVYFNNKQGGFTKQSMGVLTSDTAITMTNSVVDVDNDGDLDVLAVNNTRFPNFFYRNQNGSFVRDNTPGFAQNVSYYHGAAFSDYDNDGKLDLFLCNYFPTKYNELFRSTGNGSYAKEIADVIPAEANQSLGPTWADYDNDGYADLFVPNGAGYKNSLFHNQGNGTFKKAGGIIDTEGGQSVGSCWGDIDNDGDLDLFVTNSNNTGNFFYKNNGNGSLTKVTSGVVVTDKGTSHGCSFADVDNDGDLDLYVTNDKSFKFLYLNDGQGNFTRKSDEIVAYNFGNAFGHIWSDFDQDGDLDLFVATHSNQPNALFTNNGSGNNWINITLQGSDCNKSAIGARVYVRSNGITQMREVNAQSGFGGQSSLSQHFGLGTNGNVEEVRVKWTCGHEQVLTNVAANQRIRIIETETVKVIGGIFNDENGNCIKDNGEQPIARAVAAIEGRSGKFIAGNNGTFAMQLGNGNYTVKVLAEKEVSPTSCGGKSINVNGATSDTLWIAAVPQCNGSSLDLVMGSTAIRKGFSNNQFTITVTNRGRQTAQNLSLSWKLPASILPGTPSIPFSQVENLTEDGKTLKRYTWNFSELQPFSSQTIQLLHGNDATVNIGDIINMEGTLVGGNADCNAGRNPLTQTYRVVGAIDPNDMLVSPVGYDKAGYIMPSQVLTYTVRFQNMGNHAATDVTIVDELPEGLDLETLRIVGQSHENLNLDLKGRSLTFRFADIFLPDSTSNPEGSNGYVMFSIAPLQGIKPGTVLRNKASIIFDHYEAMETNTVINTIQSAQQEQQMIVVKSYPNPVMDVLYLGLEHRMGSKYTQKQIKHVDFIDLNGRNVMSQTFAPADELRINIPREMNGFYLLKIYDSEGGLYTHKILTLKPR